MKPSFENFKQDLELFFSQELTEKALIASEDFYKNWEDISSEILKGKVIIDVDLLMLSLKHPDSKFKKHHVYKGFGRIISILSFILLFINWKFGIGLFFISLVFFYYGNIVKRKIANEFVSDLLFRIAMPSPIDGMVKLCAHYILGTIKLYGDKGTSFWPAYPSNCINGKKDFIS